MPRARDRRVRVGDGGKPSSGGPSRRGNGVAVSISTAVTGGGGGSQARGRHGNLRYSPGEEIAVKTEIERGLRLQRLEQVRQQSRQHAAAVRDEYRQRRKDSKRAVLLESKVCCWQNTTFEKSKTILFFQWQRFKCDQPLPICYFHSSGRSSSNNSRSDREYCCCCCCRFCARTCVSLAVHLIGSINIRRLGFSLSFGLLSQLPTQKKLQPSEIYGGPRTRSERFRLQR